LGARVFGGASYSNLWGENQTVSLDATGNRRFQDYCKNGFCFAEYQVNAGYSWPWFIMKDLTFRPSISQSRTRYIEFDADTTELTLTFEKRLLKYVNLVGALSYSLERTRQYNTDFAADWQTLIIGSVTPSLRLDLRDSALAPTSGFYGIVSTEFASTAFGSQEEPFPISYYRSQFRGDYFVPLMPKTTLFLSFRTGIEVNTANPIQTDGTRDPRVAIPLIKQFSLGGVDSIRGFLPQELNLENVAIQNMASYVNYRSQLDLPLAGELRWGPFLDAGNLLLDQYSLGTGLRAGYGFGFHYATPVGPVNFDWGFKMNPRPGEDPQHFYFSLGIM
jgi:outer membrane protein insertion porin family